MCLPRPYAFYDSRAGNKLTRFRIATAAVSVVGTTCNCITVNIIIFVAHKIHTKHTDVRPLAFGRSVGNIFSQFPFSFCRQIGGPRVGLPYSIIIVVARALMDCFADREGKYGRDGGGSRVME